MKTKQEFWASFVNPIPSAKLKKWPQGNIMQLWGESPYLYAINVYGKKDDFSKSVCGHPGIDIATFHRDKVVAAHDGVCKYLRTDRTTLGGLVVYIESERFIDTDGKEVFCRTAYGHLDEIAVSEGQAVKAGDLIGYEGNTGFVISGTTPYWGNAPAGVGTHLHFAYYLFDAEGQPKYQNCMQNSFDPLPIITYKNPDYSGVSGLLANIAAYLKSLLSK